jgi:hypothetical protein
MILGGGGERSSSGTQSFVKGQGTSGRRPSHLDSCHVLQSVVKLVRSFAKFVPTNIKSCYLRLLCTQNKAGHGALKVLKPQKQSYPVPSGAHF